MTAWNRDTIRPLHTRTALACISLMIIVAGVSWIGGSLAAQNGAGPGTPGMPYANMPALAPIGVRVDNYLDVPDSAKGPAIDPAKGYRTQTLGEGLYMVTDGAYQSMFMTYEEGVVVVDAPPSYAAHIRKAIGELSDKPITHLIYSHAHSDHIGGARSLGGQTIIIAHAETNRLLRRDNDPNRPLATVTFDDRYQLSVGTQVLELSYHGKCTPTREHLRLSEEVYSGDVTIADSMTRRQRSSNVLTTQLRTSSSAARPAQLAERTVADG
jgi:hypothetical protein